MSFTTGIHSFAPVEKPSTGIKVGGTVIYPCDAPENGGIGGNIKPNKPIPGACEERPTMTDPQTGEKIYVDQWLIEQAKSNGAVFSTTA